MIRRPLSAALVALALFAGACGPATIPQSWMSVPEAARIGSLTLNESGQVTPSPERTPPKLTDGPAMFTNGKLFYGEKALAESLQIESLDLSEGRGEIALAAMHDGNYDIALMNIEGGPVHWLPTNDPADEVAVQWAPRGNKISYVIRAPGGDVVRTLHIPTAYQFAIPFTNATIHALAWDPPAERYAVAYSTPDSSDRVEVLEYDGDTRRTAIGPQKQLDVQIIPFASGAIVLHPRDIRYDEKLPVVVWTADDFAWSDARAALLTKSRVAVIVTRRVDEEELWQKIDATAWLDRSRVFLVGSKRETAISIVGDPSIPEGQYDHRRNLVRVAPAVVQSFAAGFIADHLERNPAPHGSR